MTKRRKASLLLSPRSCSCRTDPAELVTLERGSSVPLTCSCTIFSPPNANSICHDSIILSSPAIAAHLCWMPCNLPRKRSRLELHDRLPGRDLALNVTRDPSEREGQEAINTYQVDQLAARGRRSLYIIVVNPSPPPPRQEFSSPTSATPARICPSWLKDKHPTPSLHPVTLHPSLSALPHSKDEQAGRRQTISLASQRQEDPSYAPVAKWLLLVSR